MSTRPDELGWTDLQTTLELGGAKALEFLFIECASDGLLQELRRAIKRFCQSVGRPFHAAPRGSQSLFWLLARQEAARRRPVGARVNSVYFLSLDEKDVERYILARLNENRDNLVRDLRGTICLAGIDQFLARAAAGAPSIWSYRTAAHRFEGSPWARIPDLEAEQLKSADRTSSRSGAPPGPLESSPDSSEASGELADVLLSAAGRDMPRARDLCRELERDGVGWVLPLQPAGDSAAPDTKDARFIVPLLSPDYEQSAAWQALRPALERGEGPHSPLSRTIPILIRDCVPPAPLRSLRALDFRTDESRMREYPRFVDAVHKAGTSRPGRERAVHPLDQAPLDFSRPEIQELREILADLIDTSEEARALTREAGIRTARIFWAQPAWSLWGDILEVAAMDGRLRSLLRTIESRPDYAVVSRRLQELSVDAPMVDQTLTPLSPAARRGSGKARAVRIGGGSALDVGSVARGLECAGSVVRLKVGWDLGRTSGYGTAFLIGSATLLTCHHVLFDQGGRPADLAEALFDFERTSSGSMRPVVAVPLLPDTIIGDALRNWAIIRFAPGAAGERRGLRLAPEAALEVSDRISLIHHPRSAPKRMSLDTAVTYIDESVVRYIAETGPGSAGAPIFNQRWEVVALHSRKVQADGDEKEASRIAHVVDGLRAKRVTLE